MDRSKKPSDTEPGERTMINKKTISVAFTSALIAAGIALLCLLPGCSTTVESKPAAATSPSKRAARCLLP